MNDFNPACSPDGKWVYYASREPDILAVAGFDRGGEPAPLDLLNSFDVVPSPTGRMICYTTDARGTGSGSAHRSGTPQTEPVGVISSAIRSGSSRSMHPATRPWRDEELGAGRERPGLCCDPERRIEHLAAAAHRRATRADHALQRGKDLHLRVVARWPMAVVRKRRLEKRRDRDVQRALARALCGC